MMLRKTIHFDTGNALKSMHCDSHPSYLSTGTFVGWRSTYNVQLEVNPPYSHWMNPTEGAIRILRRGCRSNCDKTVGTEIGGRKVTDGTIILSIYWPQACEHARQSHNMSSNSVLEELHGHPMSPNQAAARDPTPRDSSKVVALARRGARP